MVPSHKEVLTSTANACTCFKMSMEKIRASLLWLLVLLLSWNEATNAFSPHSQQESRRRLSKNKKGLFLFFADAKTNGSTRNDDGNQVPFVIEKLSDMTTQYVFEEIAETCIDVFFNDQPTTTYVP